MFRLTDFEPQTIDVNLTGLLAAGSADPRAAAAEAAANAAGDTTGAGSGELGTAPAPLESWVTWVMGALVAAVMLGVLGIAVQRGALNTQYTRQGLGELRESLLQRMAQLDDLRAMGTISQSDWIHQRAYLKAQLVDVMQRIDGKATQKEATDA